MLFNDIPTATLPSDPSAVLLHDPDSRVRVERFAITGSLVPDRFVPWVQRHAARFGTAVSIEHIDASRLVLIATAQPEQLDALEMGCLLGPIDVWVERIERVVQQ